MAEPNKYSHTTRKMFEAGIDRLQRKITRNKADNRALKARLETLEAHVQNHCTVFNELDEDTDA